MPHSSVRAPRRLVVATSNPGKLREFRSLLQAGVMDAQPYELVSLAELGLPSPAENGETFLANALLKAQHAAASSGHAALADDSGLEVDALDGAPGIYSARYAGVSDAGADAANNAKLQRELADIPFERRTARYRCALVLLDAPGAAAPGASPLVTEGVWEGYILDAPRGAGGFGYDPYFWLPDQQLTVAQLSTEDKNRLSHRGKAMRALRTALLARIGERC
jgi:XTP/dITP diphosphohydrolase